MKTCTDNGPGKSSALICGKNHFDAQVCDFVIKCIRNSSEVGKPRREEYIELVRSRHGSFIENLKNNTSQFHHGFLEEIKSAGFIQTMTNFFYVPAKMPSEQLRAVAYSESLKLAGCYLNAFQEGLFTTAGFIYEARELLVAKRIKFIAGVASYEKKRSTVVYEVF